MSEKLEYGLRTYVPTETVFYRDYTSKARLEISLALGEDFKKIKLLFQELEDGSDGKKHQKSLIEIYVDCDKIIGEFVHHVKSGRFGKMAQVDLKKAAEAKSTNAKYYPLTLYQIQGGTMPNKYGEGKRGQYGEYRELKLQRSSYFDRYFNDQDPKNRAKANTLRFLITVIKCDGMVSSQKAGQQLILPVKDASGNMQNATKINFMLTYEQLVSVAYAIEREINSYRTSQYVIAGMKRLLGLQDTSNEVKTIDRQIASKQVNVDRGTGEVKEKEPTPVKEQVHIEVYDTDLDDLPF